MHTTLAKCLPTQSFIIHYFVLVIRCFPKLQHIFNLNPITNKWYYSWSFSSCTPHKWFSQGAILIRLFSVIYLCCVWKPPQSRHMKKRQKWRQKERWEKRIKKANHMTNQRNPREDIYETKNKVDCFCPKTTGLKLL